MCAYHACACKPPGGKIFQIFRDVKFPFVLSLPRKCRVSGKKTFSFFFHRMRVVTAQTIPGPSTPMTGPCKGLPLSGHSSSAPSRPCGTAIHSPSDLAPLRFSGPSDLNSSRPYLHLPHPKNSQARRSPSSGPSSRRTAQKEGLQYFQHASKPEAHAPPPAYMRTNPRPTGKSSRR